MTPYVAPFAVFVFFLAAGDFLGLGEWEHPFRCVVLAFAIWYFSRHMIELRPRYALASIALGIAVFLVWVGPDVLFPGYRTHWLFSNSFLGKPTSSLPAGFELSPMVLIFRSVRAIILVPIIEELFWRGWLLRWLIDNDFEKVAIGAFTWSSFLIASALFASEHGSYWEVGLLAGFAYNWWITRTKSLADCIWAHAVTNAVLSAYVVFGKHWEYWL